MNKLFAIYGNPVSHSKSPIIHNFAFKNLGFKDYCYTRILLQNGNDIIKSFKELHLSGANVTVPFKEDAFRLCDEPIGIARKIKAVNTLIKKDNKILGFNTDAPGFMKAIESFKDVKKVLILGAGGTAKALSVAFLDANLKIVVLNRSLERLSYFKVHHIECYSWNEFNINQKFDLIINTTSAGLNDKYLPAPKEVIESLFKGARYGVDVIYGKKTPFLQMAQKFGLQCLSGEEMLINQAVYAFMLFCKNNDFQQIYSLMKYALKL